METSTKDLKDMDWLDDSKPGNLGVVIRTSLKRLKLSIN